MGKYGKLRAMFYFGKLRDLTSSSSKKTDREREREGEKGREKDRERSREVKMGGEAVRGSEGMKERDIKHSKEMDTEKKKVQKMGTSTGTCADSEAIIDKGVLQINSSISHEVLGSATSTLTQVEMESNQVQTLSIEYCLSHPWHQPPCCTRLSSFSSLSTSELDVNSYNRTYGVRDTQSGGGLYFHYQCSRRQKMLDDDERALNRKESAISTNSFS